VNHEKRRGGEKKGKVYISGPRKKGGRKNGVARRQETWSHLYKSKRDIINKGETEEKREDLSEESFRKKNKQDVFTSNGGGLKRKEIQHHLEAKERKRTGRLMKKSEDKGSPRVGGTILEQVGKG